ncbi:MAG: hypothetical protein Ct9H300mP1_36220 [Planctomycetaceae bacterium]|nr:MAG: hypothetical protein Ct9H300mP1_36220 [Planctomycetaceae bacterium]
MRDFLKWGHDELGAIAHVSEVGGNWSFDGPKYRYMQELMWNVKPTPMRSWGLLPRLVRSAAQPMKAFWDRLEEVYERGRRRRFLGTSGWAGWKTR